MGLQEGLQTIGEYLSYLFNNWHTTYCTYDQILLLLSSILSDDLVSFYGYTHYHITVP